MQKEVTFGDADEGKSQDGWLLRDILLIYVPEGSLQAGRISVSSSSREKSIQLTWEEVAEETNMVMFDISNRKTAKLVSLLEKLVVAGISGVAGHLSKFLVKWVFSIISGAPLGFVAFGTLYSVISYLAFGALGGILGALTLTALRKAGFFEYLQEKR